MTVRLSRRPYGGHAVLVEVVDGEAVAAAYAHIDRMVEAGRLERPRDVVPAARTILVDGVDPDPWWADLVATGPVQPGQADVTHGRLVTLPIRYDGEDLDEVARQWSCEPEDVVRRHRESEFTVAFCGFAPGFAYCTSRPALPTVTRRDDPRTKVPAGAVGLAGDYCGVYPKQMPGGWQIIGSTGEEMFDASRNDPALLHPGDRVRFEAED
jgi:KipI family sensor histidine kinase inhibitor